MEIEQYIEKGWEETREECGKKIVENIIDENRAREKLSKLKKGRKNKEKREQFETMIENAVNMQKYYRDIFRLTKELQND